MDGTLLTRQGLFSLHNCQAHGVDWTAELDCNGTNMQQKIYY